MAAMTDEILVSTAGLPVATAGEMRLWNLTAAGVDLSLMRGDQWVIVSWRRAYVLAESFLRGRGFDAETIGEILRLAAPPEGDVPLPIRWRLYDIHRIRIALLVLYPEQPVMWRHCLTVSQERFAERAAIELMRGSELRDVRLALEARLGK